MLHPANANEVASAAKGWSVIVNPMRKHGAFDGAATTRIAGAGDAGHDSDWPTDVARTSLASELQQIALLRRWWWNGDWRSAFRG
jgi:hypothetical protein